MINKKFNGEMICKSLNIKWIGEFHFELNKRIGKGILTENGKEYFVEYTTEGKERQKKRTFEGTRLKLIGDRSFNNFIFFFIYNFFFFFLVMLEKQPSK